MALREEVKTKYEEAKAADENLAKQEERYLKIAQDSTAAEEIPKKRRRRRMRKSSLPRKTRRRFRKNRLRKRHRLRIQAARPPRTVRPGSRRAYVSVRTQAPTRNIWVLHIREKALHRSRVMITAGARSATTAKSATA